MGLTRGFRRLFSAFHTPSRYFSNFEEIASRDLAQVGIFSALKEELGARPGRILDFGCGLGYLSAWLGALGVDPSAHAIEKARGLFPGAQFQVLGAEGLKPLGRFDSILCVNVIEHVPEAGRETLFRSLEAALNPGGRLYFIYDNMYHPLQVMSAIQKPGTLLLDPTHERCWTLGQFERLLAGRFRLLKARKGNIQARTLPWGNRFHTAGLYVCEAADFTI